MRTTNCGINVFRNGTAMSFGFGGLFLFPECGGIEPFCRTWTIMTIAWTIAHQSRIPGIFASHCDGVIHSVELYSTSWRRSST